MLEKLACKHLISLSIAKGVGNYPDRSVMWRDIFYGREALGIYTKVANLAYPESWLFSERARLFDL